MQERLEREDMNNIVELKNSSTGFIQNKQRKSKLKKLKTDVIMEGFMSCGSFGDI